MKERSHSRIFLVSLLAILLLFFSSYISESSANGLQVFFVDSTQTDDSGDGSSWATAKKTIQAAIDAAFNAGGGEVWVKAGTYKPTDSTDRTISFQMKSGVDMYGGFAGTETSREDRDWIVNQSTLSGDIHDGPDDSYHVVWGADNSILDGFVVTHGHANWSGNSPYDRGAGMYIFSVSPTIRNCTFRSGSSYNGGGIYMQNSSATIENCNVSNNFGATGGGLYIYNSSPTITNCIITREMGGQVFILDKMLITLKNEDLTP